MERTAPTSEGPNKQTLKFPSAKRRSLLQPAQKCSVMEVINEMVPRCPSTMKFLAVSVGWSLSLFTALYFCSCRVGEKKKKKNGAAPHYSKKIG